MDYKPQSLITEIDNIKEIQAQKDAEKNESSSDTYGSDESEGEDQKVEDIVEEKKTWNKEEIAKTLTFKKRRVKKTVISKMEELKEGPMSILYRGVQEKLKIKVWTRSYKDVRGICTGYLVAYDKHWNLAMYDVDEVYRNPVPDPSRVKKKRKKKKKKPQKDTDTNVPKDQNVIEDNTATSTKSGNSQAPIEKVVNVVNIDKDEPSTQDERDGLGISDGITVGVAKETSSKSDKNTDTVTGSGISDDITVGVPKETSSKSDRNTGTVTTAHENSNVGKKDMVANQSKCVDSPNTIDLREKLKQKRRYVKYEIRVHDEQSRGRKSVKERLGIVNKDESRERSVSQDSRDKLLERRDSRRERRDDDLRERREKRREKTDMTVQTEGWDRSSDRKGGHRYGDQDTDDKHGNSTRSDERDNSPYRRKDESLRNKSNQDEKRTTCSDEAITAKKNEQEPKEYQTVIDRHVNQLFIRGDNIVMVAFADEVEPNTCDSVSDYTEIEGSP